MNIWDPFHPLAYFIHTTLGVAGILGAITALVVTKGSNRHILAGRIFATAAAVVAATAMVFSITTFAPMAIASALLTFSVIGSGILAHRSKSGPVAAGELTTTILMTLVLLWLLYGVVISIPQGGLLWIPPLLFAGFAAALLINDCRFISLDDAGRKSNRLSRHLSRMAFALAIAVHAPIVVFADKFELHPGLAFYGPFIIWPVIYFYFTSRIAKNMLVIDNI